MPSFSGSSGDQNASSSGYNLYKMSTVLTSIANFAKTLSTSSAAMFVIMLPTQYGNTEAVTGSEWNGFTLKYTSGGNTYTTQFRKNTRDFTIPGYNVYVSTVQEAGASYAFSQGVQDTTATVIS